MREVFLASAVRTPIGAFGGALRDVKASQLGAHCAEEAIRRAGLPKETIDESIFGCVIQAMYEASLGRTVAQMIGLPDTVPGFTVQQQCCSGMQALFLGARNIALGEADAVLVGAVENMSLAPYVSYGSRWGGRLGHQQLVDSITEITYAGSLMIDKEWYMGALAEYHAEVYKLSREEQDAYACESHRRAVEAQRAGRFLDEMVPISLNQSRAQTDLCRADERPRPGLTVDDLAKLRSVFKQGGSVTAGNSCGFNDGGAAAVLVSEDLMGRSQITPLARVLLPSLVTVGCEPRLMGYAIVPAVRKALKRTGLGLEDVELIEANEAFAAQMLVDERELGWDRLRVNVNGGGIALGHPVGSSGLRIVVTLAHEMRRRKTVRGLATIAAGSGIGTALILERSA